MRIAAEEVRRRLVEFAQKWTVYEGSERAEAQTFLNELFACYDSDRSAVARFEDAQGGKFLDLIWDRVCIVEMKRPSEAKRLAAHREQALGYWRRSADPQRNLPAPRYVVVCAFQRFEIWEPGLFPEAPRAEFELLDLPDHLDALRFLAGDGSEGTFMAPQAAVTAEAVGHVTRLYERLNERRAADPDVLRDFMLQAVWCMFAEDLGQLEGQLFTRLIEELQSTPQRSSLDELGGLFQWLNTPGSRPDAGLYAQTPYVNGGLFERPARVHLDAEELEELHEACIFDWRRVEPHIFGSLLEGSLGTSSRRDLGAHYTHEVDIQKVVRPTIVDPWRELIENATSVNEARALQERLLNYVVLDPACGSGNFLYVAYRELRRLERRLHERETELRRASGLKRHQNTDQGAFGLFFSLSNLRGIEINPFAVGLARVTLWMAHKLAVDELDLSEKTLPLEDLSGITPGDALRMKWPRADAIIGNPPFHGDRNMRSIVGDRYIKWLEAEFGCGIKDHCVYWFRKSHDHLAPGDRAGLVGTNSISQNRARSASLDYILDRQGTILNAVSTQDWPGEANVDVAIVNWIKDAPTAPAQKPVLDGQPLEEPIAASLRPTSIAVERSAFLPGNARRAFFGCVPGNTKPGFTLTEEEAERLLAGKPAEWRSVVRPYLIGNDLTEDPLQRPSRWIIDFAHMSLEEAEEFPQALTLVRQRVKPARDRNPRKTYRENWWRFVEPLREMRDAIAGKSRYIASPAQAKRIQFSFVDADTVPSNLVTVFAFDSSYALGILSSFAHDLWLRAGWSTLEDRLRYTPSTVFSTFAWPSPAPDLERAIGQAGERIVELRTEIANKREIGLTKMYNSLDEGGHKDLSVAHASLDRLVAEAYGWPKSSANDTDATLKALMQLNREIADGTVPSPF